MKEEWVPIPGYPGYEISTMQRVRTYKIRYGFDHSGLNDEPTLMIPQTHRLGYKYVMLRKDGESHKGYIHRLMALAFIPNPENKPEINHINGDKTDNRIENLEWCTRWENMQHARETGLVDTEMALSKARDAWCRKVYFYEEDMTFDSLEEAARYFGVSKSNITHCCQGVSHHVKGYHLCYLDDIDYFMANLDSIRALEGQKKRVKAINLNTGEERIFSSRQEASKELGVLDSSISNIIAGRLRQSKGWTFKDMPVCLEAR